MCETKTKNCKKQKQTYLKNFEIIFEIFILLLYNLATHKCKHFFRVQKTVQSKDLQEFEFFSTRLKIIHYGGVKKREN